MDRRPLAIAALVLVAWTGWAVLWMSRHHGPMAFVHIGRHFARQDPSGPHIHDAADRYADTDTGFDGQFAFYVAADFPAAPLHMDAPGYRMSRILYPLAAMVVSLGDWRLVPLALLLINLAAVTATVWALAVWLSDRGGSPWWALVYGFHPGLFTVIQGDLTEALAYALVALGVLALSRRDSVWPAAVLLCLAGLTRETAVLFPAILAAHRAVTGRRDHPPAQALRDAGTLLALGVVPVVAWHLIAYARYGAGGAQPEVSLLPFGGLLGYWPFSPPQWLEVLVTAVPATLLLSLAAVALRRGRIPVGAAGARGLPRLDCATPWLLLVNVLALCVLLQRSSWSVPYDSLRVGTGIVLAGVLALPALRARVRTARLLWPLAVALWFASAPAGLLLPHQLHVFKL